MRLILKFIFVIGISLSPQLSVSLGYLESDFKSICRVNLEAGALLDKSIRECPAFSTIQVIGISSNVSEVAAKVCDPRYSYQWHKWNSVLTCKLK